MRKGMPCRRKALLDNLLALTITAFKILDYTLSLKIAPAFGFQITTSFR